MPLAQFNFAVLATPLDSPQLAGFVAALDDINALADQSAGFIWRLLDDAGNATAQRPLGENVLVNMSVWRDVASLRAYVYESGHVEYLRRRREWFVQSGKRQLVLWWVEPGHVPTVEEAIARLDLLREHGPTQEAFDFRQVFADPR